MNEKRSKKALLLAKDASDIELLRDCLSVNAYELVAVKESFSEIKIMANNSSADILLADVNVIKNEGIELQTELFESLDLPVVLIISDSDDLPISQVMKIAPHGFLIKPFNQAIFNTALEIAFIRFKSRRELFETQELIRSTLNSIDDLVFTIDAKGHFLSHHNHGKEGLMLFDPEVFIGQHYSKVLPPEVSIQLEQAIDQVQGLHQPASFEYCLQFGESEQYFLGVISLRKDILGNPIGYTLVARNITTKIRREEMLHKLSWAVEQSANAIVITNQTGIIEYINKKYLFLKGFEESEVIGSMASFFDSKVMGSGLKKRNAQELKNYGGWKGELHSIRKDGSRFWEYLTVSPIRNSRGTITHFLGISEDITRKKQLEGQVWESQQKLLMAQNMAKLGTCELDLKNQTSRFNDLFFKTLRINKPANIRNFNLENLFALHPAFEQGKLKQLLFHTFNKRITEFKLDLNLSEHVSDECYVSVLGNIKYGTDAPGSIFLILNDITERKQHEKLLNEIEISRKSSEFKQKLYSALSHEIRTPLSGIQGIVSLLTKTRLDEVQKSYLETLNSSVSMLMSIINDFLDLSKIESGKMPVRPVTFNLEELLTRVVAVFGPLAQEKKLQLGLFVPQDFPTWIHADDKRIFQIVSNLVSNAVKFTQKGRVDIRVSLLELNSHHGRICIEVEDTGVGISEQEKEHLFTEFHQLQNAYRDSQQGSGLGLSICKKFVQLLGGQIDVESKPGEGSVFWFDLPVNIVEQKPQDVQEILESKEYVEVEKFKKLNILLVDDKMVNQKVIGLMLESMGCQVHYASNGQEAIAAYHETQVNAFEIFGKIQYDLIFMDIRMPVMDGFQALHELKNKYKGLPPVLALSANSLPAEIEAYAEAGFEDYLIKPVTLEDLEQKINKWVIEKQAAKQAGEEEPDQHSLSQISVLNHHTIEVILKTIRNNPDLFFELINTYVSDMETIIEKIKLALQNNDMSSLQLLILTVKGLSGSMGGSQLHEISKQVDRFFRADNEAKALEMIPFMLEKYYILKAELTKYYKTQFSSLKTS